MKSFRNYLSEDQDGEMAISQLRSILENATKLLEMMSPQTNLEPWVQSKLTKAQDYISVVHDYMTHAPEASAEDEDSVEENRMLPSDRNDQRMYRNSIDGSKVARKHLEKTQDPNYKPDAHASARAKRVHRGDHNA